MSHHRGKVMDLVFHMSLPMLLAILAGVDRRKAILLMPFAVLPDSAR